MNPRATESLIARPSTHANGGSGLCAAFVIDADGNVLASNSTARELWQAEKRSWVAKPFAGLFAAATPTDGDIAAQWTTLKAQAGQQWLACTAQTHDGAKLAVRVQLERAFGGGGSYIAVVQPVSDTRRD